MVQERIRSACLRDREAGFQLNTQHGGRLFDPWAAIPRDEFLQRQARARRAAEEARLDGLVVYSRGVDGYGDVLYLMNHYSQWPFPAEHIGLGIGRTHSVSVIAVGGAAVLISDVPWWRDDLVVADEVRVAEDVTTAVAKALRDTGLQGKRVGLVGLQFMTAAAYLGLAAQMPDVEFVRLDALVERLRVHKTDAERRVVRAALGVANEAMDSMLEGLVAGATESEVVSIAVQHLEACGAVLLDAACSSGPSAHQYTWARLPSRDPMRELEHGDLFHMDYYGSYGGYYWDFARTRVVGDDPDDQQAALIDTVTGAVEHVCSLVRPGVTAGELYDSGARWLDESAALRRLDAGGPLERMNYFGHGLGMGWEGPWLMSGDESILEEGDVISIEYFMGRKDLGGAMLEQNGFVTASGYEPLTTCPYIWHR